MRFPDFSAHIIKSSEDIRVIPYTLQARNWEKSPYCTVHSLSESSWVSDVCIFEGQFFARGGDSLGGRGIAMQNIRIIACRAVCCVTIMDCSCLHIRGPMLCQRRGQPLRTGDGNAKHLDHHLQSRVTYHHGLQTSTYSRATASP
jgi:hypothetical protein